MFGIGTDIIEIDRIRRAYHTYGDRFLNKIFTKGEQAYCFSKSDPYASLAVRFAAKEAVSKALGTGIGKSLKWKEIEISRGTQHPQVSVPESLLALLEVKRILLSMSHCREYATAVAIAEVTNSSK
ncbi:holo-ACP synthase [Chlamydia muridarum str. Nigg]|jgi:phosphopantethiene--protein transferase domain|uniref:Holo-[acyl-carrier-protein] synthase n=2 Tax=Chlamydia muridarum TaxID=83560 RepID=ACPS_CHLMU|nr:holo-ACP synthase [Chlamydia muridarum]Q9PKT6.1 RecName: Full=Holo-[acyl-carrier-protein] synthase; Short=Holo-ACP synthase; AltName: Full=4'-phosphopantetheinyl transferase AcpS [Chlamydia muridarum str. Nigg]UFT40114.1 holo-ACP synthase [Chlamydia trachomatis]AAF39234.1 holo-(acyl-carrier protein) synthase [Chlamydia muridarum str. Nigg]AHH22762.1 4'-phosphopantetheinyl transferase [Chlamydia muridarum str. Nigg3 CMUT3-5]AHH23687.1 4'-phosphopantetheinyl transferase [Chlamydia muridarum s